MRYKVVQFREEDWQSIKTLADYLTAVRGSRMSLPATINEAVKFYKEAQAGPQQVAHDNSN